MTRGEIRDTQIASLISEELEYVLSGADDQRLGELTVTAVEPGKGGSHYIVHLTPAEGSVSLRSAAEVEAILKAAAPYIRSELASAMQLKRMPQLTLMLDPLYTF